MRIVVADDEQDTREYLQELLCQLGHEVRAVANGKELVEACRRSPPDLIVTDYAMPGMNGWVALQQVHSASQVPAILFSGRHDVTLLGPASDHQVLKVLIKPVKENELISAIRAMSAPANHN